MSQTETMLPALHTVERQQFRTISLQNAVEKYKDCEVKEYYFYEDKYHGTQERIQIKVDENIVLTVETRRRQ